ncbi:MAG: methyltransferase domain-containing protein [Rhodocyclaceae bacterium]|nr:methyltransferase domain-containing protein [Rhodocyclaceae bacterium]
MKPISFLSFDVEALPGRAEKDHIDRLVWGRIDGKEYGIRRISDILQEYRIKGNFLIDLSAFVLYGERVVADIGKFLLNEGHELHVHLHSEWVIRKWGIKGHFSGPPGLNVLDQRTNEHLLKYAFFTYRQLYGSNPIAFRGGGFTFNEHTVAAAKDAGFRCLTNFNSQRHAEMLSVTGLGADNEPFAWNNGLAEIPVDFSPEPLSFDIQKYFGWYDRVKDRKKIKTFNLTMHSWSLMKRQGEFFTEYAAEHEDKLRFICEHLSANTRVLGYAEYLEEAEFAPVSIQNFQFRPADLDASVRLASCSICNAIFAPGESDVCPGCGARARHRQVLDALTRVGNPLDGRRVLACFANSVEKACLLSGAAEVRNFDVRPLREADFQMDIQHMDAIADGSFDGFLAIHVLNHVKDDRAALAEIYRVLVPGGVALLTVPYRAGEKTADLADVYEHYGAENFNKYGVGSFRRYGLNDAIALFSSLFEVSIVAGLDAVTGQAMNVFLLRKRVST